MRIKTRWHKTGKPKSMKQQASVMAFIIWRLARGSLQHMREEKFEIDPGQQYFAFLIEFLIFLIQIADRIAYRELDHERRTEFTTALALRLAEILEENQRDLLGTTADGSYKEHFISLCNRRSADYATFAYTNEGPDFAFMRYLGNSVREIMGGKDKPWVTDQVIQIEAPEAVKMVQRGMEGLFEEPDGGQG